MEGSSKISNQFTRWKLAIDSLQSSIEIKAGGKRLKFETWWSEIIVIRLIRW